MTHFQQIFIQNLRFFRRKKGLSQLKLSELLDISPNYLNAVERGKNFPSPEIIQCLADVLEILPYQLFLEHPAVDKEKPFFEEKNRLVSELHRLKHQFINDMDKIIETWQG
jgi:transcriptional regulator with XRE-family HTH domain